MFNVNAWTRGKYPFTINRWYVWMDVVPLSLAELRLIWHQKFGWGIGDEVIDKFDLHWTHRRTALYGFFPPLW